MSATAIRTVFFGWKVVAAAFVLTTFTFGVGFYGPSVFLEVLHQQRGWSLAVVSSAITVHFLTSALLVLLLPDAHRRFGMAVVTQAGVAALAIGMFLWSAAGSPFQLFAAAMLSGAGWAATSAAAIVAMVSPWFDRGRPLALGHAFNGVSVGGVLFTPLWVMLIAAIGFTQAAALVAGVTIAVLWPLAWRYLRPTPESLGLAMDGDPRRLATIAIIAASAPPTGFAALVRRRDFVTLSAAFAFGMFAQIGVLAHLLSRLSALMDPVAAAAAVSLATACAVIGRLVLGGLLGDADRRRVAAGNFVMQACGVLLLAFGSTAATLVAGCMLLGLGIGSLLSLPPLIAQKEFCRNDLPRVVALVTAVNQAVFAFAPAVLGLLREASGSYAVPFAVAAAVQLMAGNVILLGRRRT